MQDFFFYFLLKIFDGIRHGHALALIFFKKFVDDAADRTVPAVTRRAERHFVGNGAEHQPWRIFLGWGDPAEDNDPDVPNAPPAIVDPSARGRQIDLFRQFFRVSRADRIEAEVLGGYQVVERRADLFPVVDVMAAQFFDGPTVQAFLMGFVRHQVVGGQILQPVRQRGQRFSFLFSDDHHVQELLLQGEILFEFDFVGRIQKEIRKGQSEQAMPGYHVVLKAMK